MPKFEVSVTYYKVIEAADKEQAAELLNKMVSGSELDGEYGAFADYTGGGSYLSVEEVEE
jgi:hypothetical protein